MLPERPVCAAQAGVDWMMGAERGSLAQEEGRLITISPPEGIWLAGTRVRVRVE